ncbi:MAG: dihydrofolate reductase [Bacteroidales bacterium]|nr:dihydrofolate reductase [Bacteroidales bacterium]
MIDTNKKPNLSIIVALATNRAIGLNGDMPWHLSGDLKRFKALTMGHTVVMGRRTWESLPKHPLAGRRNIVFSQSEAFAPEGAEIVHSINGLFDLLKDCDDEVFIIGGGRIYNMLMPWVNRLYITWVYKEFTEADTFFPVIDLSEFTKVNETEIMTDEKSGLGFSYAEYDRKYECNNH